MMLRKLGFATAIAMTCGLSIAAFAHNGATGIVKERMDLFAQNKDNLKAIKAHLRGRDFGAIIPLATQIRDWAQKMPDYFPTGTGGKPSEASPEVWSDFRGFEAAATANYQAANDLILAAQSGNIEAARRAFKATASTCKSCHKSYRLD